MSAPKGRDRAKVRCQRCGLRKPAHRVLLVSRPCEDTACNDLYRKRVREVLADSTSNLTDAEIARSRHHHSSWECDSCRQLSLAIGRDYWVAER